MGECDQRESVFAGLRLPVGWFGTISRTGNRSPHLREDHVAVVIEAGRPLKAVSGKSQRIWQTESGHESEGFNGFENPSNVGGSVVVEWWMQPDVNSVDRKISGK